LLAKDNVYLQIREDRKKGIFVDNLSEWPVSSPEQILKMMKRGAQSRPTASTKMNEVSSRSHAIFIVTIERTEK
jgi:Kinesin motor domain